MTKKGTVPGYVLTETVICSCHSPEHQLTFDMIDYGDGTKHASLYMHLAKKPFLKRVWYALLYIMGRQCKYGAFDEIVLDEKSALDLMENLQRITK